MNLWRTSIFFLGFLILVLFNYFQAQYVLTQFRPANYKLINNQMPTEADQNQPTSFSWQILAPNDQQTTSTGIYYSYTSSPSALTKFDSPQAVGYSFFTSDYQTGNFKLPDHFDLNINFSQPGVVFYRTYAKIGSDNLWSSEYQLNVK